MKLSADDINTIVAYWAKSLRQTVPASTTDHAITIFLNTLENALANFSIDSMPLKVCVGVRKFIPEKNPFADVFNYAKVVSGIPMGNFAYGASMTVYLDNAIMVSDGFYKASYRYILTNLTTKPYLQPEELKANLSDESNQNTNSNTKSDKYNSNKRAALTVKPLWDVRESKYMRLTTVQPSFFSNPTIIPPVAVTHKNPSSLNIFELEDLFEIKEPERAELSLRS